MSLYKKRYSIHRGQISDVIFIKGKFRSSRYDKRRTSDIGASTLADIDYSLLHQFFHSLLEAGFVDDFEQVKWIASFDQDNIICAKGRF